MANFRKNITMKHHSHNPRSPAEKQNLKSGKKKNNESFVKVNPLEL